MITIKVPASSANIGPGFDCCGLALQLYNVYHFELHDTFSISGCDENLQNSENLVYTAYKSVYKVLNLPIKEVSITIEADIPQSRGLGSSSACIIGGVMGANALLDYPLNSFQVLALCCEIEGHSDNIAPALFGGLCVSFVHDCQPQIMPYNIDKDLIFTAIIPDFELSTKVARAALPSMLTYADSVHNIAHLAVVLKCLENKDFKTLKIALSDLLHEPYRAPLIKEFNEVKSICQKHNAPAFYLSGSGPTLMCISDSTIFSEQIKSDIQKLTSNWCILPLKVETQGALNINGGYDGR